MRVSWVFTILIGFFVLPVHADDVLRVATPDQPPFAIHDNGKPAGLAYEVLADMLRKTGTKAEDILIPWSRLEELGEKDWAIFPSIGRTPAREDKFRWIGKIYKDRFCFFTLKGTPPVASMDAAKKLRAVAASPGGISENHLKKEGLTNLEFASGNTPNAKKLVAKKVDAWFIGETSGRFTLKSLGQASGTYECTGEFVHTEYWMATSKKMSDANFNKLQKAFHEAEKGGLLQSQLAKLN